MDSIENYPRRNGTRAASGDRFGGDMSNKPSSKANDGPTQEANVDSKRAGGHGLVPSPALVASPALERLRQQQSELAKSLAGLVVSPALEGLEQQQSELAKSLAGLVVSPALEGLRQQQSELAKSLAGLVVSPAMAGLGKRLRQQQSELAKSLAGLVASPASEGLRRQEVALQEMFRSLAAEPGLSAVREQNGRIAAGIGNVAAAVVADELGAIHKHAAARVVHGPREEISTAIELLSSLDESLPVGEDVVELVESSTGQAEVFALLAALVWLSVLIALWLSEANRTGTPPILETNRFQLVGELYFLAETTRQVHERVLLRLHLDPLNSTED